MHFCTRHRICIFLITFFFVCAGLSVCFYRCIFDICVSVSLCICGSVQVCGMYMCGCECVQENTLHLSFISAGDLDTNVSNVDVGSDALNCAIVKLADFFFSSHLQLLLLSSNSIQTLPLFDNIIFE